MRSALLLVALAVPVVAHAADSTSTFRFAADPANMTACLRMAPQLESEHILTVAGDTARLTAPGGVNEQMKPVKANVYDTVIELAGERLHYVADLDARAISVRGNNLGCKWSAKL
jgi:hypothetical protein